MMSDIGLTSALRREETNAGKGGPRVTRTRTDAEEYVDIAERLRPYLDAWIDD